MRTLASRVVVLVCVLLVHQMTVVSSRGLTGIQGAGTKNNAVFSKINSLGYLDNPFIDKPSICTPANLKSLAAQAPGNNYYTVNGYPSSPSAWQPFTLPYKNPPIAKLHQRVCRDDSHCTSHYEMDVKEVDINVGCKTSTSSQPTTFMAYGGTIPGASLYTPEGEEVMLRLSNKLVGGRYGKVNEEPCGEPGRGYGVPISCHGHGQASLAPFDGWAENRICANESKVYVYPNNRAALAWYHDHSLDITASNAYRGLAGMIPVIKKKGYGANCGEPWGLDNVPDYHMIIGDKLVDDKCQLRMDETGVHADGFYGDVNVVSGTPWPVLTVYPTHVRFRFLVGGPTRPYKYALVNSAGKIISNDIMAAYGKHRCQVVAGDGGFRVSPVGMSDGFIFIGVADRWEIVCDLTDKKSEPLFMVNMPDDKRTTGNVPSFCFSHLLAKINVLPSCPATCSAADAQNPLKLDGKGNYVCKDTNGVQACCPDGTACFADSTLGYSICKNKAKEDLPLYGDTTGKTLYRQWPSTCWLGGEPEVAPYTVKGGVAVKAGETRCGGPNFGAAKRDDDLAIGPNTQRACCPQDQFCWHSAENVFDKNGALAGQEWYCRKYSTMVTAAARGTKGYPSGACPADTVPYWADLSKPATTTEPDIDKVLRKVDLDAAMALVAAGKPHRTYTFGRSNGQWTINGKTWFTQKIQAQDVGQNSWELWKFETGGGWFHPIHVHLVDFWVVARGGPINRLESWEGHVGKDVVSLHPSGYVYVLARFGAHRGDYMFHCHNLRHEDNAMMAALASVKTQNGRLKNQDMSGGSFITLNEKTSVVYDTYNASTGQGQGFWDPDGKSNGPGPREDAYWTTLDKNGNTVPLTYDEVKAYVDEDYYRIFYPSKKTITENPIMGDRNKNLWMGQRWQDHVLLDEAKGITDPLCPPCPAS